MGHSQKNEFLLAEVQRQAFQITSTQQTIQAQDRRIHENAREIAVLRSYKDEHLSTHRASYLKSLAALKPDSPKPWASIEDDINDTREMFREGLTKAYIEMVTFNLRYRTNFINASMILHACHESLYWSGRSSSMENWAATMRAGHWALASLAWWWAAWRGWSVSELVVCSTEK